MFFRRAQAGRSCHARTLGDVLRPELQHYLLYFVGVISLPVPARRAQAASTKDSGPSIGQAWHEAGVSRLMKNAIRRYVELVAPTKVYVIFRQTLSTAAPGTLLSCSSA